MCKNSTIQMYGTNGNSVQNKIIKKRVKEKKRKETIANISFTHMFALYIEDVKLGEKNGRKEQNIE